MQTRVVLSIVLLLSSLNALASSDADKLKELVQYKIEEQKLEVGVAIAIVNGDAVEFINVGTAQKDSNKVIDSSTLFEIGSITKTFTSMALASMVDEGKVKLNEPVQKYLPKNVSLPKLNNKAITFLSLANHSSGLPGMPINMSVSDYALPLESYSIELMYESLNQSKLSHEVGEGFEYSNFAVGFLGHVLALIDNKSYEQMIIDRVLSPLDMKNTFIKLPGKQKRHLSDGHDKQLNKAKYFNQSLTGAGAIKSNIKDMARYLQSNISHETLNEEFSLVQKSTIRLKIPGDEIGLGWFFQTRNEIPYLWHGGETFGFHSFIGFNRESERGIVILSNTRISLEFMGWAYLTNNLNDIKTTDYTVKLSDEYLEQLVGRYELPSGSVLTISHKGDQLYVESSKYSPILLSATSKIEFMNEPNEVKISFNLDNSGKAVSLDLELGGRVHKGIRL